MNLYPIKKVTKLILDLSISADSSLNAFSHPMVNEFIEKYTQHKLKSVDTIRRRILPNIYNSVITEYRENLNVNLDADIDEEIPNRNLWFSMDGTTDSIGNYASTFVVGQLGDCDQRYVINVEDLDSKSAVDLHKFFVKSMGILFNIDVIEEDFKEGEILLFFPK